jgi:hypothetical protein
LVVIAPSSAAPAPACLGDPGSTEISQLGFRSWWSSHWAWIREPNTFYALYGTTEDTPLTGRWTGDTGFAVRRGRQYLFRFSRTTGNAQLKITFGNERDAAVAGDFDGDGCDELGVVRCVLTMTSLPPGCAQGELHWNEDLVSGAAEHVENVPLSGFQMPLAGDWDGDGTDSIGLYEPLTSIFTLYDEGFGSSTSFRYGQPGDIPLTGDWDGDGDETVGVARGRWYLLRNTNAPGPREFVRDGQVWSDGYISLVYDRGTQVT